MALVKYILVKITGARNWSCADSIALLFVYLITSQDNFPFTFSRIWLAFLSIFTWTPGGYGKPPQKSADGDHHLLPLLLPPHLHHPLPLVFFLDRPSSHRLHLAN